MKLYVTCHRLPALLLTAAVMLACAAGLAACAPQTEFTAGSKTDTGYINDSVGLILTLPDGWAFYDDALIEMMMSTSGQLVSDKASLAKSEAGTRYEFMVYDPAGDTISLTADTANARLSLNRYIRSYKQSLTTQIPGTVCVFEDETPGILLGGSLWTRLTVRTTMLGVEMTQYVYFLKTDNAILTLTAADLGGHDAAYYEAMFTSEQP